MKCSKCGTTNEKEFHSNSIIGLDLAIWAEENNIEWAWKPEDLTCLNCYYKNKQKQDNRNKENRIPKTKIKEKPTGEKKTQKTPKIYKENSRRKYKLQTTL